MLPNPVSAPFAIPTIDLFAGAGGLALGASAAGADLRLAVDNDRFSCDTLEANRAVHGGNVACEDIRDLTGDGLRERAGLAPGDGVLVIGGAPCQPFSKAAYWLEEGADARYRRARAAGHLAERPAPPTEVRPDGRRSLVEEYWRIIKELDAEAFVFENVKSITHPRNRPVLEALNEAAEDAGFHTTFCACNAVEFGVPQRRHRVFLMGSRRSKPVPPQRTHADPAKAGELGLRTYATAGPALEPYADISFFEPGEGVVGRWAEHLLTVPPGGNYKAHTAWGGHPAPTWETETRYWNFLLKLSPSLPSWTVNASPGPWTGPFHWDTRRLRTPELAALQTFPQGYRFEGPRRERVRQIGNAVPVKLAEVVVAATLAATVGAEECDPGAGLAAAA
jgi:DNA (cytosine-5)-methyltransferase 1